MKFDDPILVVCLHDQDLPHLLPQFEGLGVDVIAPFTRPPHEQYRACMVVMGMFRHDADTLIAVGQWITNEISFMLPVTGRAIYL